MNILCPIGKTCSVDIKSVVPYGSANMFHGSKLYFKNGDAVTVCCDVIKLQKMLKSSEIETAVPCTEQLEKPFSGSVVTLKNGKEIVVCGEPEEVTSGKPVSIKGVR